MTNCYEEIGNLSENDKRQEFTASNRIFLNFTRQSTDLEDDCCRIDKVKKLFKFLAEKEALQQMKALGWFDEEELQKERDTEKQKEYNIEDFENGENRCGGQRFLMSRDFWFRRLNILKAQKLDEAALEAKDGLSRNKPKDLGVEIPSLQAHKMYSDEMPEKREDVMEEIDVFEKRIAKPVESELKKRFMNVYDNKIHFCQN